MKTLTIKAGEDVADFFRRAKQRARLMDQHSPLPEEYVISFGDPSDLLDLLSNERLELFRAIKNQSGSISSLAQRLDRDRGVVEHDVNALEKAGLLHVEARTGHVHVTAPKIRLEAEFA